MDNIHPDETLDARGLSCPDAGKLLAEEVMKLGEK